MIQVHSTLTRSLVPLDTREEGKVAMYVCGPTVQSEPHVGHGRSAVAFDVIRRYLTWRDYEVTFVRNITDVEDKIIAAAEESGIPAEELAVTMARRFAEAFAGLGVLEPDVEPKATESISQIIEIIEALIERGLAYDRDGDVYFSVRSLAGYGRLSGRKLDDLRSGYRIEVDESKDDPLDFALWKAMKPGEPCWDSPWGPGRPGWHIECSAMAGEFLGNDFDIHAGGSDLIFPHHENEIAQSEGATGEPFARYWLHNGMVNLGGEKMAKSTGLVVDLASIIESAGGRALRMLFVRAHYRSPIEYSSDLLGEAAESLERLDRFRERATASLLPPTTGLPDALALERFTAVMDDDFNTPEAVSMLFDLVRDGNRILDEGGDVSGVAGVVEVIVDVLGIDEGTHPVTPELALSDNDIARLVGEREKARMERRFADADAIRDTLEETGVMLEDGPDGTRWLRK